MLASKIVHIIYWEEKFESKYYKNKYIDLKICLCVVDVQIFWNTLQEAIQFDLDFILHNGDNVYKQRYQDRMLNIDEYFEKINWSKTKN